MNAAVDLGDELECTVRASFALAALDRQAEISGIEVSRDDIGSVAKRYGTGPTRRALRIQGEMLLEEAAALETYGTLRGMRGDA